MSESTFQTQDGTSESARLLPDRWSFKTWCAVLSMAATSFALVSAEFLPSGLLTPMARDIGVTEGVAGQMVTATAAVGAVAALVSNVFIGRVNRKTVLIGLSALAVMSIALVSITSSFTMMLLGRAGLGIALSGFWALSVAIVARLVGPEAVGRGMAIVTLGVSLATIAAPSMGALLSDWVGWRAATAVTAGLAVLAMLLQLISLPSLPASSSNSIYDILRLTKRRAVQLAMLLILLLMTGHFAGSVYVRPFLERITLLETGSVAAALFGFGVAAAFGNMAGGRLADWSIKVALLATSALIAIVATALVGWGANNAIAFVLVFTWGFAFGMAPVVLPINLSRSAPDALELAGSLMVVSFQVAISTGAILGGYLLDHFGAVAPLTLTAALAAVSVAVSAQQPAQ